jgi:hypothetical protein
LKDTAGETTKNVCIVSIANVSGAVKIGHCRTAMEDSHLPNSMIKAHL